MDPVVEHDERPDPYLGGYPHGAYWSAIRPEGAKARAVSTDEYFSYEGTSLRIMWDEGAGTLWADGRLLGGDAEWMRRALALVDALIDDLLTWMQDVSALHDGPVADDWQEQSHRLDSRGEALAERLKAEVGQWHRVWYHS